MYNVSTEYKNYIKMPSRTLSSRILIGSETYTDYEIADMKLEGDLVPGEEFTLGTTVCTKFEATIMTDNMVMALNVVKPYIGLEIDGTVEEVPLGVFNIDDVKDVKGNKQIVAYDNMMKLEKAYFSDLTYPATIQAVANEIAQKAGISFNGTLPTYEIEEIEGKTLREAIGIIAGICGGFARINRLGQLEIVQLTTTDISVTADNFFGSLEKADKSFTIKKITAIKEDNSTITAGSGLASEEITFSNNFITQSMIDNILATYNNYSYMPLKMEWQGNPAIDVGDIISITDIDDTVYQIPVMRLKLTYSGGLKSEISSVAKSESKSEYNYKGSISKKVEVIATEQANIKVLMAQKATIEDLEATNAEIDVLKTNKADISALTSINAAISNLQANKANITDLAVINASIDNLQTNKADITQLNAATGRIGTLESDVANIETILSKDVFSELATVGKIVAGSQIIAEGAIGSAQISDLNASKLSAGIADLSKVTIQGTNGRLKIANNKLQVFDGTSDLFERVVLGDVNGDGSVYGLRIRGADGTTILFDENGQTKEGFTDGYNKLDDNSLNPRKLDIAQVVTRINEGTTTIQGSKISVDGGTLDVKFSTLKNTVNSYGESISTHSSQISALDNAIKLKVDTQTYNTKMTNLDNSISVINTNLSKATSDISILQGQIVTKVSQTEIDNSINALAIGGRNLLQGTKDWSKGNVSGTIQAEKYKGFSVLFKDNSLGTSSVDVAKWQNVVDVKPNTEYTLSFYAKGEGSFTSYFYPNTSTTGYSSEGESVSAPAADGKITHSFTSEWKKYWIVWKTTSGASGLKNLIPMRLFTGSKGYICGVKFEEGNKATDWTPAPEDVEAYAEQKAQEAQAAAEAVARAEAELAETQAKAYADGLVTEEEQARIQEAQQKLEEAKVYAEQKAQEAADAVEVGGRNLIIRSTETPDTWINTTGSISTSSNHSTSDFIEVNPDTDYAFSKITSELATDAGFFRWAWYDENQTYISRQARSDNSFIWKTPSNVRYVRISYPSDSRPKFEKGNKPTDWSPAPEDVQSQIDSHSTRISTAESSITQLTNSIALKVDTSTFNSYKSTTDSAISSLSSRVNAAELKITDSAIVSTVRNSTAYNNDLSGKVGTNEIISKINQSAESITIQANKIGLLGETNIPDLTANKIKGGTLTLGGGPIGQDGEQIVYDVDGNAIIRIDKDGLVAYSGTINVVEIKEVVDPNNSVTTLYNQSTIKSEEFYAKYIKELGVGNPQRLEARIHAFDGLILKSQGSSYGFNDYNLKLMFDHVLYDISDYSYHKFSIGGIPKFEIKDTGIEVYGDAVVNQNITARGISIKVGNENHEIWHNGNCFASPQTTGFQELESGVIIQWGTVNNTNGVNGVQVSFPKTFKTVFSVVATPVDTNIGNNDTNAWVTGLNNYNFYLRTSRNSNVRWIAVGIVE